MYNYNKKTYNRKLYLIDINSNTVVRIFNTYSLLYKKLYYIQYYSEMINKPNILLGKYIIVDESKIKNYTSILNKVRKHFIKSYYYNISLYIYNIKKINSITRTTLTVYR